MKKIKIIEEIFNAISHGLAALAAITGLVIGLITISTSLSLKVGFIIYASSLITLLLASTLYHSLKFTVAAKVFRAIDHSSIFILIAGSFTPFIVFLYSGWVELVLLIAVWLLAAGGIAVKTTLVLPHNWRKTGVLMYVVFGWLALIFIPKLSQLDSIVVWLVISGGLTYTFGTIFYAIKKPFMHLSWHLFVVGAAISHFFAITQLIY